jgi:hypothetical protein
MTGITNTTARSLAIAALALGPAAFSATAHADGTTRTTATSGTTTTQTPPSQDTYRGRYQLR